MVRQDLPRNAKLALRAGFRLQYEPAQESEVLLFPEGMITLSDSASQIMKRCDGTRTTEEIVADLEQQWPSVELRNDVVEFLEVAWRKGWLAEA